MIDKIDPDLRTYLAISVLERMGSCHLVIRTLAGRADLSRRSYRPRSHQDCHHRLEPHRIWHSHFGHLRRRRLLARPHLHPQHLRWILLPLLLHPGRCQFYQHFTFSFFEWKCFAQLFSALKILAKLTSGVNFIIILWACFSYKRTLLSFSIHSYVLD